ncbi:hypothetical protein FRB98_008087 [Tulasnella sp. 332]|nr:hypothetical protein FRB98_008087 [Tulasnella sp. 332]
MPGGWTADAQGGGFDEYPSDAYGLPPTAPGTAPSSAPPSQPPTPAHTDNMILHDTSHEHIEIQLPNDTVVLRGVGQEVEPVVLSGNVVVNLEEATNIREIALNFTGKARLPQQEGRHHSARFGNHNPTYTLFSRDWNFLTLEGTRSHRHTLKAGRHVFPFQLNIDDTFPPSMGMANSSITYKLRATVVRPSFSSNWITQRYVNIIRGFSPEALEYSQTVEIENTWPGKVMYSIMIPHKAFAGGDYIPALLKFTPIAKGCSVTSIEGTVKEYSSVVWKGASPVQTSKVVAKCKYEIHGGAAIDVLSETPGYRRWAEETYGVGAGAWIASTSAGSPGSSEPPVPNGLQHNGETGDGELTTWVKIPLWKFTVPTSTEEPIVVAYKLKWSIMLSNLDGHTSELRAALPIHILHHSLLSEARAASHFTRSLLFGTDFEPAPEQTITLPSYASHVHDRVANALDVNQTDTRLAPNPLHNIEEAAIQASTVTTPSAGGFVVGTLPANGGPMGTRGGYDTPGGYFSHSRSSQSSQSNTPSVNGGHHGSLPVGSTLSDPTALQFVDEGLLLSLGVEGNSVRSAGTSSRTNTPPESRRSSLAINRTSSSGTTPEIEASDELPLTPISVGSSSGRSSLFSLPPSLKALTPFGSNKAERGPNSRTNSGGSMSGGALATLATQAYNAANVPTAPPGSRSAIGHRFRKSSIQNLRSIAETSSSAASGRSSGSHNREQTIRSSADLISDTAATSRPSSSSASAIGLSTMSDLLSRVPDYQRASQGFLGGGVTPLDASRGLPTYADLEQVARVRSEGALLEFGRRAGVEEGCGNDHRHTMGESRGRGRPATAGPTGSASPSDSDGSSSSTGSTRGLETPQISVTASSSRSASGNRRKGTTFTLDP